MIDFARSHSIAAAVLASIAYALPWTVYMAVDDLLWVGVVFSIFFLTAFVPLVVYVLGGYVSPLLLFVGYSLVLFYDFYQHETPEASVGFLLFFPPFLVLTIVLVGIETGVGRHFGSG